MFFYHIFLAFCCCLLFMRINIYIQWSHAYRTTKTIVKRYALSLCLHISGDFIHPFGCYKAHTTYFFRCVVLCIFSCDFPRLAVCAFLPSHMPHNNILSVFFCFVIYSSAMLCWKWVARASTHIAWYWRRWAHTFTPCSMVCKANGRKKNAQEL